MVQDPTFREVGAALEAIFPLVQAIKSSQERYIPLTKLKARPGRKEVQDGKEDLLLVLKNSGRYNPNAQVQGLEDFSSIMDRLKELVDENDMEDLRNSYRQASEGKSFEKSHEINMGHLLEALTSIINKNSGEQAIKRYLDLQVQSGKGVSKQADGFKRAVGDILPETS